MPCAVLCGKIANSTTEGSVHDEQQQYCIQLSQSPSLQTYKSRNLCYYEIRKLNIKKKIFGLHID